MAQIDSARKRDSQFSQALEFKKDVHMAHNYEMLFERTIQSFLGDKAFHIAGQFHSEKSRKDWYKQVLKVVIKNIQDIDTSTKHKERLAHFSEGALKSLSDRPYNESVFALYLLRLMSALL